MNRHSRRTQAVMRFAVGLLLLTAISALALTRGWGEARVAAQSSTPKKLSPARGPRGRPLPPESFGAKKSDSKAAHALQSPPVSPQVHGCPSTTIGLGQTINGALSATDCRRVPEDRYFDAYTFTVSDGQRVAISMSSAGFDTYLALFDANDNLVADNDDIAANNTNSRITQPLPGGTYLIFASSFEPLRIGNYSLTLAAGTDGACTRPPTVQILSSQSVQGALNTSDCQEEGFYFDTYTFYAAVGQQVAINLSGDFDVYLLLIGPNGEVLAEDDNGGGGTNARIPQGAGFGYLPFTGTYAIIVSSSQPEITGNYSVSLSYSPTGCSSTPIRVGQTINGSLSTSDCRLVTDGSFIDVYTLNGTIGQQVAVSLSGAFDAYLILLNPDGSPPVEDDNGGGGADARIPAGSGFFTLPATGTYTIFANSSAPNQTGSYTLTLSGSQQSCSYTLAPGGGQEVGVNGGNFILTANAQQTGCAFAPSSNASWITVTSASFNSNGIGTVNYRVAPNTTGATRTGTLTVGAQTFTVTQSATCQFAIYPSLRPFISDGGAGRFTIVTNDAQCNWGNITTNASWINITTGNTGSGTGRVRYAVSVNQGLFSRTGHVFTPGGTHTVTQTASGTVPSVRFSVTSSTFNEGGSANAATLTVTRTGNETGAVTVEYATVDNTAAIPCSPSLTTERGTAYARCDYATTVDTLTFAPFEMSKSFTIPLVNDAHPEGHETFQVVLRNPAGATVVGGEPTHTVLIVEDDTTSGPNPIFNTPFFVRQQYLDFLSREPEPAGLQAWLNVLNNCSDVNNNPACDRITVSAAFFGSPEFRLKGFYVFLFYKMAFGNAAMPNFVPEYEEIIADMRRVTGATAEEVFAKRLDFSEDFVQRPAFTSRIGVLTQAQQVDTLLANVGATLTTPDPVSGVTRDSLVADLQAGRKTLLEIIRLLAETEEVNRIQFNHAFVAMQYYGFLRRKPEAAGYQSWLNYLRANPNDARTMVNGFVNSQEYFLRFGQP